VSHVREVGIYRLILKFCLFVTQNCISDAVEAVTELVQRLLGVGHCFTCTGSKVGYFTYI
jgi:hypothetical protein